jgi:glucose-6-phosphate 1-dehydrogenase
MQSFQSELERALVLTLFIPLIMSSGGLRPNWLVLRISPDEGISLQFEVKRPGPVVDLAAVKMDFRYDDSFPREPNVG